MKEEREERMKQDRVKHQAQRRPATGRLLCLIFCWQAGGEGERQSGRRMVKRQGKPEARRKRGGCPELLPALKAGAQKACTPPIEKYGKLEKHAGERFPERLFENFFGEFQENSKVIYQKQQENRQQKPKL